MGLLDIDVNKKAPIRDKDLLKMGFRRGKDGVWVYRVIFRTSVLWTIRYYPRGTYSGVRLRNSRLVFKDLNYLKYEIERRKKDKAITINYIDVDKKYDCPRARQIVIQNPGMEDIEMCKFQTDQNSNLYKKFLSTLIDYKHNSKWKLGEKVPVYEEWLKNQ